MAPANAAHYRVRALDRADRFLVRGGEDRWKGALDDDLVVELCRLASCGDNEIAAQVEAEARKLVEEISQLHDRIVSLHKTYGKDWEQPLLESLLREWHLDPSMAAALLERR